MTDHAAPSILSGQGGFFPKSQIKKVIYSLPDLKWLISDLDRSDENQEFRIQILLYSRDGEKRVVNFCLFVDTNGWKSSNFFASIVCVIMMNLLNFQKFGVKKGRFRIRIHETK